ncbi:MAG: D-2-hydroxyacid dehydrogenase [Defluviitaleaceae bacterium]|nr:D-2-hydroxyacid dehydrogenase [Defluviitaleaceae bacterium]
MKIVILDGYSLNPGDLSFKDFEKFGDVSIYDKTSKEDLLDRIHDAEIVIVNKVPILKETIDKCKNLKYIGLTATGYDNVDVEYAGEKNIIVTNVPAYSTFSVAQFTISLLLEICNNVSKHNKVVKDGEWENIPYKWYSFDLRLMELYGKTIGIIGMGRIGRAVANIASALGMNIITYGSKKDNSDIAKSVSFDELLKNSDVISLHCPLYSETRGIINKDSIEKMKDGAIILNTSRGGLIVDEDLANALNTGKLYAAGLDVVSVEPILKANPLLKAKNCFITPHVAWAPIESRERLLKVVIQNLQDFLDNKFVNLVN